MPRKSSSAAASKRKAVATTETQKEPEKKRSPASRTAKVSSQETILALFSQYVDAGEDRIGPSGMERLFADIDVAPDSIYALILAWYMGAQEMGYFSKEEFEVGLEKMKAYTVDRIAQELHNIEQSVTADATRFVDLYKYAFSFSSTSSSAKSVDVDTAAAMLELVLPKGAHTSRFADFLRSHSSSYRVINRDQWMCFLEFSKAVRADLSNYDEAEAWPIMFDEYADFVRKL